MKTIAVPTSFSVQTLKAMQLALQLFPNEIIQFILFSQSGLPTDIQDLLFLPSNEEKLAVEIHEHFDQGIALLKKRYAYQIKRVVYDHFWGDLPFVIKQLNDQNSIDFLLFPQSNSFKNYSIQLLELIKMSLCPLLLVPDTYTGDCLSKVGWIIDDSFSPAIYLQVSDDFFSEEQPETLFMIAAKRDNNKLKGCLGSLLDIGLVSRKLSFALHRHWESSQGFISTTISHCVDLIILQQKYKRSSLRVKDRLVEEIALSSPVPVLIFPRNHFEKVT